MLLTRLLNFLCRKRVFCRLCMNRGSEISPSEYIEVVAEILCINVEVCIRRLCDFFRTFLTRSEFEYLRKFDIFDTSLVRVWTTYYRSTDENRRNSQYLFEFNIFLKFYLRVYYDEFTYWFRNVGDFLFNIIQRNNDNIHVSSLRSQ